jgi:hypothetical protein
MSFAGISIIGAYQPSWRIASTIGSFPPPDASTPIEHIGTPCGGFAVQRACASRIHASGIAWFGRSRRLDSNLPPL